MAVSQALSAPLRLIRLHQPVGIWLLFWPCAWAWAVFAPMQSWGLLVLFWLGAFAMRSAGCVMNDVWDKELDAKVSRTATRPLASGELSIKQAFMCLLGLLVVAFAVALTLGAQAILWGALALPLVVAYPLMKRVTWWPQMFLGLTFNWGALLAAAVITHGWPPPAAWWLYAAGVCWTLGYDTLYAVQDVHEDAAAGIKSTARRLGRHVRGFVLLCYTAMLACLSVAVGFGVAALWLALPAFHLVWQWKITQGAAPCEYGKAFRANALTGWLVFSALMLIKMHGVNE